MLPNDPTCFFFPGAILPKKAKSLKQYFLLFSFITGTILLALFTSEILSGPNSEN